MENLDLTTIINRIRELSNATPVTLKGHDGTESSVDATLIAATIVGGAIGGQCQLPTRPTPMLPSYFASTHGENIQKVLSKINEAVNIRTQVAYDAALAVWTERYNLVHKPCNLDTLLFRIATNDTGNANQTSLLLTSLNETQRETLEKIMRSVNLSCSKANVQNNPFAA